MSEHKVGFIGFGHMAKILFGAMDRARLVPRSQVVFLQRDPSKMKQNEQAHHITSTSLERLVQESRAILLCVRPQQVEGVLDQIREIGGLEEKWIVSILAGTQISLFQKKLGDQIQVVRVMPNLASQVGEGMSVLSFGPHCSVDCREFGRALFSAMGEIAEVPEHLMDIACGMAGSGPGFVFRLIEAMARTGEKHGMSYAQALKTSAQAFAGAARLILKGETPANLLMQIATPNGTTQAGLDVMTHREIDQHFQAVIEAAATRSKELSKN